MWNTPKIVNSTRGGRQKYSPIFEWQPPRFQMDPLWRESSSQHAPKKLNALLNCTAGSIWNLHTYFHCFLGYKLAYMGHFFSFCFRLTPLRRKVCYKTGDSTPPTRLAEPERIHDNRTASSDDFVIGLVILLLFCAWERVMEGEGRILSEISQQLLQTSKQGHVFKWWTFLKPVIVVLKHGGPKWI